NTFGTLFRVTTFGESHGAAIGAVIDGCPARLQLLEKDIQLELDRRRPGQSLLTTQRKESDKVKILSGVFEGVTLGSPIAMIIENADHRSLDYAQLKSVYRPGHADYAWDAKYGFRDYRGGGRASGRETASRVMAGAVAKKLLSATGASFGLKKAVKVFAYAKQVAGIVGDKVDLTYIEKNPVRAADPKAAKKMEEAILNAAREGDSVGGVVEIVVKNMPVGLGEPVFDKLSADIAKALFSIQTVKAVEIGSGHAASAMRGSEHNDKILSKWKTANNYGGGISGGISTGEDLVVRVTVKPPSSISKTQETVTTKGRRQKLSVKGRHDPCIIPRFIPVAEAMVA
ncbi:MAG: chorismate synthase, partial [Nitrospinae bacterium RIFCSPLOWO2_12_FULL_47_7]